MADFGTDAQTGEPTVSDAKTALKVSWPMLSVGILLLIGLTVFVIVHVGEVERFALLLLKAQPEWLLLAIIFQAGTYFCAGTIWHKAIGSDGERHISLGLLARLSVEQLSINQIVPSAGVSGNLLIFQTLKRRGLSSSVITEALGVEIIASYLSYGIVALLAMALLSFQGDITRVICYVLAAFALLIVGIVTAIVWIFKHARGPTPRWVYQFRAIARMGEILRRVSTARMLNTRLLLATTALSVGIFVLDGATLWTTLKVAGVSVSLVKTFVAVVIAFIAGTVCFLPGGLGGFEAASVATLTLCAVPMEAALVGTLLFRGLSLWMPLLPGLILARQDVAIQS